MSGQEVASEIRPTIGERYREMWARYQIVDQASTPRRLDVEGARRAVRDGCGKKDIALMLAAGSSYTRQLEQHYGKAKARDYVNYVANRVCWELEKAMPQIQGRSRQDQDLSL